MHPGEEVVPEMLVNGKVNIVPHIRGKPTLRSRHGPLRRLAGYYVRSPAMCQKGGP